MDLPVTVTGSPPVLNFDPQQTVTVGMSAEPVARGEQPVSRRVAALAAVAAAAAEPRAKGEVQSPAPG